MTFQYRAVLSPCIGICTIDDDGFCLGLDTPESHAAGQRLLAEGRIKL